MKNLHFAELKNNIPCLAGAMQPGSFAAALFSAILLSLFIALAPRAAMCAPSRGALEPANEPAVLQHSGPGKFVLKYHGLNVLSGAFYRKDGTKPIPYNELDIEESKDKGMNDGPVTQKLTVSASSGEDIEFRGAIEASGEAFPAETRTAAQERFPLVRNSDGLSRNLRNNAVYDRKWDWMIESYSEGGTRIMPSSDTPRRRVFSIKTSGVYITISFRPRYYQKHKNIRYFQPWKYSVKKQSVAGWCSWWAYMGGFTEKDLDALLKVWDKKRMRDYGYRYIQIDDTFQTGKGMADTWLKWNSKFPAGIEGYSRKVRAIGCEPAIWIGITFEDESVVKAHPDWFVQGTDGKPAKANWISYGVDATVKGAADNILRPIYSGFKKYGFTYVKIDALRHLMYESLRSHPDYAKSKGMTSADIHRRYMQVAREELGPDTFILACWGVLPETAGIADGIRLGGDGFGPATMQQYNSWNGVVWHNDPDHCDLRPSLRDDETDPLKKLDKMGKKTKKLEQEKAALGRNESIIRPTLVSMAGAMLMLSDKAEVYSDDANLEGAKRAAPIPVTVPGQLYDYDPARTDTVKTIDPDTITNGGPPSPIDALQQGDVAQWWLLEIDRPFEHWTVLSRMNWSNEKRPAADVKLTDIGLDPAREYLIYEFWTHAYLGTVRGSFTALPIDPLGTQVYAIREKLDRPQIISTSRHITQGGAELRSVSWRGNALTGRSVVVAQDLYELGLRVPSGWRIKSATIAGKPAVIALSDGELARVAFTPAKTGDVDWKIVFEKTGKK